MEQLRDIPFDSMPLEADETVLWEVWEPTFHRFSYYAIVVTNRAVYLYAKLFFSFARWRRIPLSDIESAEFVSSWFMPKLVLRHRSGLSVLRTPPDTGDAARIDREQLKGAADFISASIGGK